MNLIELLKPAAVFARLKAEDDEQVIRLLGGKLQELGDVSEGFVQATLDREREHPTGLPLGGEYNAALPHVEPEYVLHPAVALATLAAPIGFHHMVERERVIPVQLVIMLALDSPEAQVQMLQQVAGLLQDPELVAELLECDTAEQLLGVIRRVPAPD